MSDWVSEWVTRSPIELFWTAKNRKKHFLLKPSSNVSPSSVFEACGTVYYSNISQRFHLKRFKFVIGRRQPHLIFVTCTTCGAGVKIFRLVSKNPELSVKMSFYHHHQQYTVKMTNIRYEFGTHVFWQIDEKLLWPLLPILPLGSLLPTAAWP